MSTPLLKDHPMPPSPSVLANTASHPPAKADLGTRPWHASSAQEVLDAFVVSPAGLTVAAADERRSTYGPNVLPAAGGTPLTRIIWAQINNALIWVLIASAVIAVLVDPKDGLKNGLVILAVVTLNSIIGVIQEFKANKAIAALPVWCQSLHRRSAMAAGCNSL
jgi:magnesium-transporting ATPase (P-type)